MGCEVWCIISRFSKADIQCGAKAYQWLRRGYRSNFRWRSSSEESKILIWSCKDSRTRSGKFFKLHFIRTNTFSRSHSRIIFSPLTALSMPQHHPRNCVACLSTLTSKYDILIEYVPATFKHTNIHCINVDIWKIISSLVEDHDCWALRVHIPEWSDRRCYFVIGILRDYERHESPWEGSEELGVVKSWGSLTIYFANKLPATHICVKSTTGCLTYLGK